MGLFLPDCYSYCLYTVECEHQVYIRILIWLVILGLLVYFYIYYFMPKREGYNGNIY